MGGLHCKLAMGSFKALGGLIVNWPLHCKVSMGSLHCWQWVLYIVNWQCFIERKVLPPQCPAQLLGAVKPKIKCKTASLQV